MVLARWLFTVSLALLPVLGSAAYQQAAKPTDTNGEQNAPSGGASPHAKVTNPHGPINMPCQDCHTYSSWKPIRAIPEFNHDHTSYPLRGMHKDVACSKCHTSLVFRNVSTHCADCHADIHRRQFGANCESCHSVKGWQVSLKDIRNHQNRFPLVGAHAMVDCVGCHKGAATGQFTGLSTACYSCHQTDYQTPLFDHVSSGFPTTCETCHSMDSWLGAKFNHLALTGFALTGMHATIQCSACHINNKFKGTPADCFACHQSSFLSAANPNHVQLGLPHDCGSCHTTLAWIPSTFNHANSTFPLTGAHTTVKCALCHVNNNYSTLPIECSGCHLKDFNGTTKPAHLSAGFPTGCTMCHTTVAWIPSSFNHAIGKFPLTGAHTTVKCALCHVNNNYTTLPTDCYSCHIKNFTGTTNPNHIQAAFPRSCTICHTTANWTQITFNHNLYTKFPLTGMHAKLQCAQCHINGKYTGTPADCYSCHTKDYNGATNPNHAAAGFPTDCSFCHSTSGWSPSTFDHSKGSFPLTGAHTTVKCSLCHVNNNFTTVPTDCYSCHKANYTSTTNPNHIKAGFPTTCTTCHTTVSWAGAVFDHSKTPFPLTGAHKTVACTLCHINNVFAGTPTDCYSCHKTQYNGTTNPNHITAGFPTTCAVCHTTTSWSGATFNHTWFSTKHGGANGVCATCHTNSSNYAVFTCTNCHAKTDTDRKHNGISGYVYNSVNCYACHKNAGGGGMM